MGTFLFSEGTGVVFLEKIIRDWFTIEKNKDKTVWGQTYAH